MVHLLKRHAPRASALGAFFMPGNNSLQMQNLLLTNTRQMPRIRYIEKATGKDMEMAKMTKAERIFNQTMIMSRRHIRTWGYTENSAWSRMDYREDEHLCICTINAMEKLAKSEARKIDNFEKYGICTAEDIELYRNALEMTSNTIANERKEIESWNEYRKGNIDFDTYMATK